MHEHLKKFSLLKAVRLGHPARVMEKIHKYSLDAILDFSHETAIVKDVRREIDTALVCLHFDACLHESELLSKTKLLDKASYLAGFVIN